MVYNAMQVILGVLPFIIAPCVLAIFSIVSAYVFRFGMPHTGIIPDYVVFSLFVILAALLGGVI